MNTLKHVSIALVFTFLLTTGYSQKIVYSTFLGGSKDDGGDSWLKNFSIDGEGNIYFAMCTNSKNFPVTDDAYDKTYNGGNTDWGDEDLAIVKFNILQNRLKYASYYGGSSGPEFVSQVILKDNNMYMVGNTGSSNFPVSNNAYDKTFNGPIFRHADGFLSRFEQGKLSYSTFVGTSGYEGISNIFFNNNGEIMLLGTLKEWSEIPVKYSFSAEKLNDNPNACILRFNAKGDSIIAATLLGPSWYYFDMARDNEGNIYIAGTTPSNKFPVTDQAYDTGYNGGTSIGGGDIFVAKLNPNADQIIFSTYLGGSGDEEIQSICLDKDNNIIVCGRTYSKDFPVTDNALNPILTTEVKSFISKLSNDGKKLLYSSYHNAESIQRILTAKNGDFYICGYTDTMDYPVTSNAMFSKLCGGTDMVFSIFDSTLTQLKYSTYIGSPGDENGTMELDNDGNPIIVGITNSAAFPVTAGSYDVTFNGVSDIFIMKLDMNQQTNIKTPDKNCNSLKVFPNPSSGLFYLSYNNWQKSNVDTKLFNTNGRLVQSKTAQNTISETIDLTGQPKGIYFLKCIINDQSVTQKLYLK